MQDSDELAKLRQNPGSEHRGKRSEKTLCAGECAGCGGGWKSGVGKPSRKKGRKRVVQRQIRTSEEKDYPDHRPLTEKQDHYGQSYTLCQILCLFCGLQAKMSAVFEARQEQRCKAREFAFSPKNSSAA